MYNSNEILNLLKNRTKPMPARMNLCLDATNENHFAKKDKIINGSETVHIVMKDCFGAIWNSVKKVWVGFTIDDLGQSYNSHNNIICTDGPYKLNEEWAKFIKLMYNTDVSISKILHTSPEELEKVAKIFKFRIIQCVGKFGRDIDKSILIPLKDEIEETFDNELLVSPKTVIFPEHIGRLFSSSTLPWCARALEALYWENQHFYIVYIKELNDYIGIEFANYGSYDNEENLKVSGPYKLTSEQLEMAKNYFKK